MQDSFSNHSKIDQGRRRILAAGVPLIGMSLATPSIIHAQNKDPIRIGTFGPLSHYSGADPTFAIQMAIDEINGAGGIAGRKVELLAADGEGTPEKTIQAIQELAVRGKVHAIVGGHKSGAVMAALPHIVRFKIPLIVLGAASPAITQPVLDNYNKNKFIFRNWINSDEQAVGLAVVLNSILKGQAGVTRFALDAELYKWASDYAIILKREMAKYGLELVYETSHDPAIKDFTPIFQKAVQARAEALIVLISNDAGYVVDRQWAAQKVPLALVGNNNSSFMLSSFWRDTEGACEYEFTAGVKAPLTDKSLQFWDKFESQKGHLPFYTSVNSYDAPFILKQAIERAGSTNADDLVSALEKTDYVGAAGRYKFNERHEPEGFVLPYGQWREGKKIAIWPPENAVANYKLPPWIRRG